LQSRTRRASSGWPSPPRTGCCPCWCTGGSRADEHRAYLPGPGMGNGRRVELARRLRDLAVPAPGAAVRAAGRTSIWWSGPAAGSGPAVYPRPAMCAGRDRQGTGCRRDIASGGKALSPSSTRRPCAGSTAVAAPELSGELLASPTSRRCWTSLPWCGATVRAQRRGDRDRHPPRRHGGHRAAPLDHGPRSPSPPRAPVPGTVRGPGRRADVSRSAASWTGPPRSRLTMPGE